MLTVISFVWQGCGNFLFSSLFLSVFSNIITSLIRNIFKYWKAIKLRMVDAGFPKFYFLISIFIYLFI